MSAAIPLYQQSLYQTVIILFFSTDPDLIIPIGTSRFSWQIQSSMLTPLDDLLCLTDEMLSKANTSSNVIVSSHGSNTCTKPFQWCYFGLFLRLDRASSWVLSKLHSKAPTQKAVRKDIALNRLLRLIGRDRAYCIPLWRRHRAIQCREWIFVR